MGFFNNYKNIGKINILLKQIEPKVNAIQYEVESPYPNRNRIRVEAGTISVLMSEIMDIAGASGRSVLLAPYYFFGRKMSLMQISAVLAQLVEMSESF
jgi:hypothetical protein